MTFSYQLPTIDELYAISNLHCDLAPALGFALPFSGVWTYHRLLICLSAISAILCWIFSFGLILDHLFHFSNPVEQKQIVRIILTIPLYAASSFFSIWFYSVAWYLFPIPQLYSSFALIALFYLLVHYVVPHQYETHDFIATLKQESHLVTSNKKKHGPASLGWFYLNWVLVFQLLPGRVATTIAREVIEATYCPLAQKTFNARTILSCVEGTQLVVCIAAILRYYRRFRPGNYFKGHWTVAKMFSLKGLVFAQIIQNSIIAGLADKKHLVPTVHVDFLDLWIGTGAFITCVECVIFSAWMLHSYSARPYKHAMTKPTHIIENGQSRLEHPSTSSLGFFRAIFAVLNIWDIISGTWVIWAVIFQRKRLTSRQHNGGRGRKELSNEGSQLSGPRV